MTITVSFKHLPRGGKYSMGGKYYVRYNSLGSVWAEGNKQYDFRLPKFLWSRLK